MIDQDTDNLTQDEKISRIRYKHRDTFALMTGGFAVLVLVLIGVAIFSDPKLPQRDYWINVYVTVVGTVLAVFVIDQRAEQRATRQRKEELILQMGSPDHGFAVEAARLLRQKGWLTDGSLEAAHLGYADLSKAHLEEANLRGASLIGADLTGGVMHSADLSGALLTWANLSHATGDVNFRGAEMDGAILRSAILIGANLTHADLSDADLSGADLRLADLTGANLTEALLWGTNLTKANLTDTTLPDGTKWTPETDMRKFTHPDG